MEKKIRSSVHSLPDPGIFGSVGVMYKDTGKEHGNYYGGFRV